MKKISQLMREGATMLPQNTDRSWFEYDKDNKPIAACAEGCAAWAHTQGQSGYMEAVNDIARTLARKVTKYAHPMTGETGFNLHFIITDLNDEYKWPVEQIADWLESVGE